MFKNRFLLVLGLISILVVSLAISSFRTTASPSNENAVNDFDLGNPDWTWAVAPSVVRIGASDYYERHPELSASNGNPNWTWAVAPSVVRIGASDYYERHPELSASAKLSVDQSYDKIEAIRLER